MAAEVYTLPPGQRPKTGNRITDGIDRMALVTGQDGPPSKMPEGLFAYLGGFLSRKNTGALCCVDWDFSIKPERVLLTPVVVPFCSEIQLLR